MTAQTAVQDEQLGQSQCWCCGISGNPAKMVHLGNHPEVTLCTRCAHAVSKWAWENEDADRTGFAVRARDQFRGMRKAVVRRGWHHSRLIGRPLRWLGKHLP
jgi:hypothetical protein